jgi:hypothetical protein
MLEPREGQCHDVSLSGMCILTRKPSPRGALIRFECLPGGAIEGLRGTARVVWQRSKSDDPRGPAGMGVRFVRLEPGGRELLEALLETPGNQRKPSGSELLRTPTSSSPTREPAGRRPDDLAAATPPAKSTGVTQQGMGAARKRSARQSTLLGIGLGTTTSRPTSNGISSASPADGTGEAGGAVAPRSSPRPPLGLTLPGHVGASPSPFPTAPSAPPDPPAGEDRAPGTPPKQPDVGTTLPEHSFASASPFATAPSGARRPIRRPTGTTRPVRRKRGSVARSVRCRRRLHPRMANRLPLARTGATAYLRANARASGRRIPAAWMSRALRRCRPPRDRPILRTGARGAAIRPAISRGPTPRLSRWTT